jgi:uncharacterized membrane protein YhaH (DUF805 family)
MSWFMTALKKYAVFSGRSRRREYWYFGLFYLIFYAVLAIVDGITGSFDFRSGLGLFTGIWTLALLIPSIAVSVRRLHDTGRRGWWILLGVIPVIGAIILIVFLAQDSEAGTNRFGPNPKSDPGRPGAAAAPAKPWSAPEGKP